METTNKFWALMSLLAGLLSSSGSGVVVAEAATAPEYAIVDLGSGFAHGINNRGQVVGRSGNRRAALWDNGTLTDLGTLRSAPQSTAYDINDRGQIVGYSNFSQTSGGGAYPVLWENGTISELPSSGGFAQSINNRALIVGTALWDKG